MDERRSSSLTEPGTERELVITRVIDAPRELVFKAWTDPAHLARWWGPKGFTNPVCEADARPGGAWYILMRAPDGTDHPWKGIYREIAEPERLVFTNTAMDKDGNALMEGLTTITFVEEGNKTKLTLRARAVGVSPHAGQVLDGMEAGWTQTLERLDARVARTESREILATRVFDAPRELVFQMWTDPTHIAKWWGPRGFTNTVLEMDVSQGGVWRVIMHGPDGVDYPNKIVYIEVVKPERLIYSQRGDGSASSDPFEVTVTFAEQGGKTRLTVRMVFDSTAARDRIVKEFGAIEGLNSTLDRLEEQLS